MPEGSLLTLLDDIASVLDDVAVLHEGRHQESKLGTLGRTDIGLPSLEPAFVETNWRYLTAGPQTD